MKVRLFGLIAALSVGWVGTSGLPFPAACLAPCRVARAGEPPAKEDRAFSELLRKVQEAAADASEGDVKRLLEAGTRVGRLFPVASAVKPFLRRNLNPSPGVLLLAADNARLVGDLRTAVSRYKSCLAKARPGPRTSAAAADLYVILIDFLDASDDAYQWMREHGDRFRDNPLARKFDGWFLAQALRRADHAAYAGRLAIVMRQRLPLEQERLHFWEDMDRLMVEVSRARKEHHQTLPHCKSIVRSIRGSRKRQLRYGLYVAMLEFTARREPRSGRPGAPGAEELDRDFVPVIEAARGYFDAFPTASTLKEIVQAFAGGHGGFDHNRWRTQGKQKGSFFVGAFERLGDAGRRSVLEWERDGRLVIESLVPGEKMVELALAHPQAFRESGAIRRLPFAYRTTDPALRKKQASFLDGVPSRPAAVVNSLASSNDLIDSVLRLLREETWHLQFKDAYDLVRNHLWSIHESERGRQNLPPDYFDRVMLEFGREGLARTPAAIFDVEAAKQFVQSAWREASRGSIDKSEVMWVLRSLDWVPYAQKERKDIFSWAHGDFRRWANRIRRDRNADPAEVGLIGPLGEAFRLALDPKVGDPSRAPDPLTKKMAMAVAAVQQKDTEGFMKLGRELYEYARDYEEKRTPYGAATIAFLLQNRPKGLDTFDLQCEILADHLSCYEPGVMVGPEQSPTYRPGKSDAAIARIIDAITYRRWNRLWEMHSKDKDKAKRLNELFCAALEGQMNKGKFSGVLFDYVRATRRGRGWSDPEAGADILARMIREKTLLRHSYRHDWRAKSATVSYMSLVRHEFGKLSERYPPERYFDDMFVEEAEKTRYLDYSYWDCGRDQGKKVVNAAARILRGYETLPFGYGDDEAVRYSPERFRRWQEKALSADAKLRDRLIADAEACYGRTRFDSFAMGAAAWSVQAQQGRSLPKTEAGKRDYLAGLARYIERAKAAPARIHPPHLRVLFEFHQARRAPQRRRGHKPPERAAQAALLPGTDVLLEIFPGCTPSRWWRGWDYERVPSALGRGLESAGREAELYALVPHFWKIARDTGDGNVRKDLATFAQELMAAKKPDLAAVVSAVGMEMLSGGELPEDVRNALLSIRSKALVDVGTALPVPRNDPRYPVYSAQARFNSGNVQSAWELFLKHSSVALRMFKELDPKFVLWLIARNTEARRFTQAEALARRMMQWVESTPASFDPEVRGKLLVAYADISFTRRDYPRARAQFSSIAAAKEFKGTRARDDAEIRIAEVDRLTKQYDRARERLERLIRSSNRYLRTQARYELALVKYDQEEFAEAKELLDQVFVTAPDHAEARILEGRLHLKMKKLVEATEIKVGIAASRRTIVPGKPLKVTLEDQNLSVVGKSSSVEIHTWTESGDDETFTLMPFGDSKTRFQGQIGTELAPKRAGDRSLQVLGNDRVYYDFSDAFKRSHEVPPGEPKALSVTTDSELYASSGKILTRQEQEELALERMIRSQLRLEQEEEAVERALSERRPMNQVKPGNKINLRVIDPDRSATPGKDALSVRVAASSGDRIASFTLMETDTHSGVFEGSVTTASARAAAYATDSKEGTLPNYVISSGEYPAWVALPDNVRPKTFSVDLNDNVELGTMKIRASVPGRKLKRLAVQTSLAGRRFTTVAAWPSQPEPLQTPLGLEIAKAPSSFGKSTKLDDIRQYLGIGYFCAGQKRVQKAPERLAADWGRDIGGDGDRLGVRHHEWYVAHMYGWFYSPRRQARAFRLDRGGAEENIRYFLVVDGQVADGSGRRRSDEEPFEIRKAFNRGAARVDIYVCARRDAKARFELLCESEAAAGFAPCPAAMFDTATHPEIAKACARGWGRAGPGEDGVSFDVTFPAAARARVVRLVLADFETDAPAIDKITLTGGGGERILPTEEDLMSLGENSILEIVPGDRITVTYEDPKVVTRGKEVREAFMTATFTNATIKACFAKYTIGKGGDRFARYVPMRRFRPDDRITVVIADADEDTTGEEDVVRFTARTADGRTVVGEALETDKHSGVFVGGVFPVKGQPERESEIAVKEGDAVHLAYADQENVDYGIKWERTAMVEQVWYREPELRVYDVASEPLAEKEAASAKKKAGVLPIGVEYVPATRTLAAQRPAEPGGEQPASVIIGGPLIVEVLFPTIALSPESKATVYAQTSSGRKLMPREERPGQPPKEFDLGVPGTVKLETAPSGAKGAPVSPGYRGATVAGDRFATTPLDDGRFTFVVPMELADIPDRSLVDAEPEGGERAALAVRGGDEVFIGFRYENEQGEERWLTRRAALSSDVFFDVMDRRYQKEVDSAYVGETVYFRVLHRSMDTTNEKDRVGVELAASSGGRKTMELAETFEHTGQFKGLAKLVYGTPRAPAAPGSALPADPDAMPVRYGDVITVTYRPVAQAERPVEALVHTVLVHKGADGMALPFTKRFKDPKIAVQTQFTVAESYFELAKKHRKLGQESLARREMAHAKKLLDEAVRDYPEAGVRAQAEFLLANLTYEFADLAVAPELKKRRYAEAITRFNDIVVNYPESPYAPKAQYKKALVFEKMGDIDTACEEYVKLSYRYPDNELVAETIARLGQYFLVKGKALTEKAKQEADPVEQEKIKIQGRNLYRTSAEVFGRLAVRFPAHGLAGKTTLLSAQSYMRAEDHDKAIGVFERVIGDPNQDKNVKAEAMYWSGHCKILQENYTDAYRALKKLTWDYPESKWAKFARGRLTEPALVEEAAAEQGDEDEQP